MRIGMVADAYKPYISGVTNCIALNKRALETLGHEVFVFTFGAFEDDEKNVIRSPGLPVTESGYYVGLGYTRRARKLLYSMDVVHVHQPFLSGALAMTYCKPRRIPIVCTNHTRYDLYARAYLPIIPLELAVTVLAAYLPPFYRACDLVIAPSEGIRQVMMKQGVDVPIEVVSNGVDLRPFQEVSSPLERAALGFEPGDFVMAFVGRLSPEKNLQFLVEAFAAVAQVFSQARLLLIGTGPLRKPLQTWVREHDLTGRVHFTGFVPYDRLPSYLAVADAFVTASVTEVHPLTVIEAMSAGLPILGIQSPGVGDIVENEVTGLLSPEEKGAFISLMSRLVTEPDLCHRLGQQARQTSNNYAIEQTSQIILGHYQRLADLRRVAQ